MEFSKILNNDQPNETNNASNNKYFKQYDTEMLANALKEINVIWIYPNKQKTKWREPTKDNERKKINEWRNEYQKISYESPIELQKGDSKPFPRVINLPPNAFKVKIFIEQSQTNVKHPFSNNESVVNKLNNEADFPNLKINLNSSPGINLLFQIYDQDSNPIYLLKSNSIKIFTHTKQRTCQEAKSQGMKIHELIPPLGIRGFQYNMVIKGENFDNLTKIYFQIGGHIEERKCEFVSPNILLVNNLQFNVLGNIIVFAKNENGFQSNNVKHPLHKKIVLHDESDNEDSHLSTEEYKAFDAEKETSDPSMSDNSDLTQSLTDETLHSSSNEIKESFYEIHNDGKDKVLDTSQMNQRNPISISSLLISPLHSNFILPSPSSNSPFTLSPILPPQIRSTSSVSLMLSQKRKLENEENEGQNKLATLSTNNKIIYEEKLEDLPFK